MTRESRRRRWKRAILHHWWKPSLVIVAYLTLITVLPALLNTDGLRKILCNQATYVLGTDVEIEDVEVGLTYLGEWHLRLRGIHVANPSPDYGIEEHQGLLLIRKMVFEGTLSDLLRHRWQPRILIKGWRLKIFRSLRDRSLNLEQLFQRQGPPPKNWDLSPLSRLISSNQDLILSEGELEYMEGIMGEPVWKTITGQLEGTAHFFPSDGAGKEEARIQFTVSGPGAVDLPASRVEAEYEINQFLFARQGLRGEWKLTLKGQDLPLSRLTRFFGLSEVSDTIRLMSGETALSGSFGDSPWMKINECKAHIKGLPVPALGVEGNLVLAMTTLPPMPGEDPQPLDFGNRLITYSSPSTHRSGSLDVRTLPEGGYSVDLRGSWLDLAQLPLGENGYSACISKVRRVGLQLDTLLLYGLPISDLQGTLSLQGKNVESALLRGAFGGGKVTLHARRGVLGSSALPAEFSLTIDGADAPLLTRAANTILPAYAQLQPLEGGLSLVFYRPGVDERGAPSSIPLPSLPEDRLLRQVRGYHQSGVDWTLLARVDRPLRFEEPGNNSFLHALWQVPQELVRIEKAIHPESSSPWDARLTALHINQGLLLLDSHQGILGELASREFGAIRLGREEEILELRIHPMFTSPVNNEGITLPALSADVLEAAEALEKENGFLITLNPGEPSPTIAMDFSAFILQHWRRLNPKAARQKKALQKDYPTHVR